MRAGGIFVQLEVEECNFARYEITRDYQSSAISNIQFARSWFALLIQKSGGPLISPVRLNLPKLMSLDVLPMCYIVVFELHTRRHTREHGAR